VKETAFELLPLHAAVEITPIPPETLITLPLPLWGIEHEDQYRSRLCDVRSSDGGALMTADEGCQPEGTAPVHHGVLVEVVTVDG